MRTQLDCLPCFVRQSLEAAREITSDQRVIEASMREVLTIAATFDYHLSPPEMGQMIHRVLRRNVNHPDPYREIKKRSTRKALAYADEIRARVAAAENTFETALRFAIAGNIMDFALTTLWDEDRIEASLEKAVRQPLNQRLARDLEQVVREADTVLYLGDNAGETVFDRLFIEQFPGAPKVIYAVKGGPIINDATLEDAREAGLDRVAELLENGNDAPGTVLSQVSDEFARIYDQADVVIAKGQANFETLNTADRTIYFLTQMKCPTIAESYGYHVGDWIVTTTDELRERAPSQPATPKRPFTLAVASGKGGTGKTTLSVALALAAAEPVWLLDCDVEEPNAHIFLNPPDTAETIVTVKTPVIDTEKCTACGKCAAFCQFNALACLKSGAMTFPELCHGCGGCMKICPEQAITETDRRIGSITQASLRDITLVTGRLDIGQPMAPPVIRAVCEKAATAGLTIIDSPPGTSCPMIAAARGADFVLLVSEPTPFGLHDLKLAVETVRALGKPFAVAVNRAGEHSDECPLTAYCAEEDIPVALRVPDDRRVAVAYSNGENLLTARPDVACELNAFIEKIRREGHRVE
ncbi:MAG: ARMT1-like domain-containing protein [Lentisphaeria bacterium]|nr:ARMT1-like domain-containing protein [Lentisphaeria bacterium]